MKRMITGNRERDESPDLESEAALVRAAQCDSAAFEPLYQRYHQRVYYYLRLRLKNDDDAADLTHQVFLQALHALPRYKTRDIPFAVWLFRIAHNSAVNAITRRLHTISWDDIPEEENIHRHGTEVEEQVLLQETLDRLHLLLRQLDPSKQELLALRFAAGLTIPQIAAIVSKKPDAIKKQFSRLFQAFKEEFDHE
jgi:RNA polymerase sigma-70 factor (ECF subfamily)